MHLNSERKAKEFLDSISSLLQARMKTYFSFSLVIAYLLATSAAVSIENRAVDPFVPGQYPVNYTAFQQIINPFVDLNVDVYAPNAPGDFPVMYFITGFGGII